ncbi:MAG: GAF domain-containing protein, partial [bacterium]
YPKRGIVRLEDSPLDQEVMKDKIMIMADARTDPAYRELAESEGIRSILCAPLKSKDRIIGSLWLFSRKVRQFTEGEIGYITTLSTQSGVVLGNAKLYQSLRAIAEIGRAITSHLDMGKVLEMIVERAAQLMGARGASLLLLTRQEDTLEVSATYGLSERFLKKGPVHIAKSIRECLEHLVVIPNVAESPDIQYHEHLEEEGIRSILCAPLKVKGKAMGNLRVYMEHPREFRPEDLELFQILADFGAISIENARLFNHIKRDYEDLTHDVWEWYDWGKRTPII